MRLEIKGEMNREEEPLVFSLEKNSNGSVSLIVENKVKGRLHRNYLFHITTEGKAYRCWVSNETGLVLDNHGRIALYETE